MTGGAEINVTAVTVFQRHFRVPHSHLAYRERQFVAPDDPDAGDAAAVVFAKQDDTSKGIFSEFVQALEHACNNTNR